MDYFNHLQEKMFFVRSRRQAVPPAEGSYMTKRFQKYGIVCRLLGCLFIEGIWDSSLKKARVRMISVYSLYSAACILLSLALAALLVGKLFLASYITESFTKSLLFIVNSIVLTRITVNFGCMVWGSSDLLQFFRDSQNYELSSSFKHIEDSDILCTSWHARLRKLASLATWLATYGFIIRVPVVTLVQGDEEWWWLCVMAANILSSFVMALCDFIAYIVLSCCTDVLAGYLRAQITTLRRQESHMHPYLQARRRIETVRIHVSTIKRLKRSLNAIWYPALAVWPVCIILILCVTLYAITTGNIGHPDVWISIAYSAQASISFIDLAILSQALTDEAHKLKDATIRAGMSVNTKSCREQVQYLHDTIDPESMCLSGAGFFRLNKALLLSMAGSIITYAVILVQTGDELAEHVDVSSIMRKGA
uniref:Gustatory receptor n=1 Tax=Amblyomma maculatum TaxID=34609 RepID=G3MNS6_AMBMU